MTLPNGNGSPRINCRNFTGVIIFYYVPITIINLFLTKKLYEIHNNILIYNICKAISYIIVSLYICFVGYIFYMQ